MLKEWRISMCGVAVVLMQPIPKTDYVEQVYLDCIPFCKHYIYDGDAMFCELGHQPEENETCNDKIPSVFTLEYALREQMFVQLRDQLKPIIGDTPK